MRPLQQLQAQGILSEFDLHFAETICRLGGVQSPDLALAAALCSNSTASGHICLALEVWAGRSLSDEVTLPELAAWQRSLLAGSMVGSPGERKPLVLDRQGRLYLYRYWDYERRLTEALVKRTRRQPEPDSAALTAGLSRLFQPMPDGAVNWQCVAAAVTSLQSFSVISGGPGTGKTSTAVKILLLLSELAGEQELSIALAAPTGKAAARLQSVIRQTKQRLELPAATLQQLPDQVVTIHRLLGGRPESVRFRHNQEHPLPLDLLIVDEASMVDLALMCKLVEALPETARLILLGDRYQLASVEAGAVLGDICADAEGFTQEFCQRLKSLSGQALECQEPAMGLLSNHMVQLRHSYRFHGKSAIGRLAEAVNRGDASAALALLADADTAEVVLTRETDLIPPIVEGYGDYFQLVASGADPQQVFDQFDRFRVLTVLRQGGRGVAALNRRIEAVLQGSGMAGVSGEWYPGRAVMITRNDYGLGLANGDIGIYLINVRGEAGVLFSDSDGGFRMFSPNRLDAYEAAFAITVHKGQGSEFQKLMLVLPELDSPLISRELIYTAVTRAREAVVIDGPEELLELGIGRPIERTSGLRDHLMEAG